MDTRAHKRYRTTYARWIPEHIRDKTTYARWIPVHIKDMVNLQEIHPNVARHFSECHFTVQKTNRAFSAMAIDEAYEQNNEIVKGNGGAIGLIQNASPLRRWMVARPEISRAVNNFDDLLTQTRHEPDSLHHEQNLASLVRFHKHVNDLVATIEKYGNPFTKETTDLVSLCSRDIMDKSSAKKVKEVKMLGLNQYDVYVKGRLVDRSKPVSAALKRNNVTPFTGRSVRTPSADKLKLSVAKNDSKLFSKLYIACQHRDGDLTYFFTHENQAWPPCISDNGTVRLGNKSDLLTGLDRLDLSTTDTPQVTAIVFDAAALVQMLKLAASTTFLQYSREVIIPYINAQLQTTAVSSVTTVSTHHATCTSHATGTQSEPEATVIQSQTTRPSKSHTPSSDMSVTVTLTKVSAWPRGRLPVPVTLPVTLTVLGLPAEGDHFS